MAAIQDSQLGKITVRVIDTPEASGKKVPIIEARVTITDASGKKIQGVTDSTGEYTTPEAVPVGTYTIESEAFGLKTQKSTTVESDCSPVEELVVPVNLKLVSTIVKGDCSSSSRPANCNELTPGTVLKYQATHSARVQTRSRWFGNQGLFFDPLDKPNESAIYFNTAGAVGATTVTATISEIGSATISASDTFEVLPVRVTAIDGNVSVTMRRAATTATLDVALWVVIRKSMEAIAFNNYLRFMDHVLCGKPLPATEFDQYELAKITGREEFNFQDGKIAQFSTLREKRFLPFNDVDAYRLLKIATEAFLMVNCAVDLGTFDFTQLNPDDLQRMITRTGLNLNANDLNRFWDDYLEQVNGTPTLTLPYLAIIRQKLGDSQLKDAIFPSGDPKDVHFPQDCVGILRDKLTKPCLLELIWSYWHEEGMLVQTMNTIGLRYQNVRSSAGRDPLANLEIDPLRPLNNLLWGYIQDEQHRLSVRRRAYEYDHHYGMTLSGKAVREMRPADSRSKFLEAFHNLLHLSTLFFKEDDDTTVIADGFPLLHALKDVHFLLSEGAHNQFGDLPSTARIEMLMQQWLLARPEFREFLPTRIMVAYPELWMDRVDAMKKMQGWTDVSILHFHNLGAFGEQVLLSIRYGHWSEVNDPASAANWARFWRPEIQGYIQAYRAVTNVDLMSDIISVREAEQRYLPPSVHLRNRLEGQLQLKTR